MSCGQEPAFDDVCAGDRLARLLNRVREGEGVSTPADMRSTDQRSRPAQPSPLPACCADHGCDRCATCLSGTCCITVRGRVTAESMMREPIPVRRVL